MQHPAHQLRAVAAEDLEVALGPAQPLVPGLAERHGLLVVEHGVAAEPDGLSGADVVDRKLDVLGQQEEVPATGLLNDLPGEEEAGAGDGAARAEAHPRALR